MRIKRNTLLEYVPEKFVTEEPVNPDRIMSFGNINKHGECIIYLCEREIRIKDNFALQFVLNKSLQYNLPLIIAHPLQKYEYEPKNQFIKQQILSVKNSFLKANINFQIFEEKNILEHLMSLKPQAVITDFNPIIHKNRFRNAPFKIYEIDGHNIIPARFLSKKQEYSASAIRNKIYHNIFPFLTEFKNFSVEKTEADIVLEDFILNKLDNYANYKNDFNKDTTSKLSKYLNLGFISSQRAAIEVIKSNSAIENKEAFLEELIVRKELADNFCLYSEFKNYSGIPQWAKQSLNIHKTDIREYCYSLSELENGKTHDNLWNASQNQLKQEGYIHGYLRMYWAKKILEWSETPQKALKNALYLNDKYAFDSPSANGYTGILWSLGGLHDRAFSDWKISGKIRRMTYNSTKQKYDIKTYINKYKTGADKIS